MYLAGRIAAFGRALAGDVSRRLFEQFARTVDDTARTGTAPAPGSGPNPLRLAARAVLDGVRARIRSLASRVRRHR